MHIRARVLAAALAAWCAWVPGTRAQPAGVENPTRLLTGEQRIVRPGFAMGNIAIGDPRVCDFKVLPGRLEVMLAAKGPGRTLLTIWDQKGAKRVEVDIDVTSREMAQLRSDLVELLRPYPDVQVGTLGGRLVITGTVQTQAQLKAVRAIAQAAGSGVQSLVTAQEGDPPSSAARPAPAAPRASTPPVTTSAPAGASQSPRRPLPAGTSTPVPLGSAAGGAGTSATGVAPAPSAVPAPVAAPPMPEAAADPPAPNVSGRSAAAPSASSAGARPAGSALMSRIDYELELFETMSDAPPPEVMGPQGRSLLKARVSTTAGTAVRQFISVDGGGAPPAAAGSVSGISIGLRPAVEPGGRVRTALVLDTNLPIGRSGTGGPVQWARAQLEFTVSAGETRYLTERELGQLLKPYSLGADATRGAAGNPAGAGAKLAIPGPAGDGVQAARGLGSLFARRGAPRNPKAPAPEPVLLIVITPFVAAAF
jgi:hypothetical protein